MRAEFAIACECPRPQMSLPVDSRSSFDPTDVMPEITELSPSSAAQVSTPRRTLITLVLCVIAPATGALVMWYLGSLKQPVG